MKKILLVILATQISASLALADLSLECTNKSSRVVRLDLADGWHLQDTGEPTLKKSRQVTPIRESSKAVEFLHDFGNDVVKMTYLFTDLQKCGVYGSDDKVVTLKKGIRGLNGTFQSYECTCAED